MRHCWCAEIQTSMLWFGWVKTEWKHRIIVELELNWLVSWECELGVWFVVEGTEKIYDLGDKKFYLLYA